MTPPSAYEATPPNFVGEEFCSPEASSTFLAAMIKCVSRVPAGRAKSEA